MFAKYWHQCAIHRWYGEQGSGAKLPDRRQQRLGIWRLDQDGRRTEPQRKHEQYTETEGEAQGWRPDIAVPGLCLQQMAADHVGHRKHITMEMHDCFRLAGGT